MSTASRGADTSAGEDDPLPEPAGWHGRLQVRRENIDRATTEETTKTFLRSDNFVWGGMLSFQLALPDAQTDFGGSPFDPRLGDSKTRFRFAPFSRGRYTLSTFVEATFPTADPGELGGGKYQLSAGLTGFTSVQQMRFTAQLQQVNSVAGDAARADINYTKLDLSLRNNWEDQWLKAAVNTRADWEQGGKTGAVGEIEYGHRFGPDWGVWVMLGGLLWGEGVKATYGSKVMLGVDRWF